jgi:hypothetical protein
MRTRVFCNQAIILQMFGAAVIRTGSRATRNEIRIILISKAMTAVAQTRRVAHHAVLYDLMMTKRLTISCIKAKLTGLL